LKIVGGPADTIKLPFRKLNFDFMRAVGRAGEQGDTETLRLDRKRHLQEVAGSCGERFVASGAG
jgi:hypothetical protein